MKKTYLYTFLGIAINAAGNSLTIVTNLGSLLWPASIVNIMHAMHWSMSLSIFTEGMIVSFATILLEKHPSWKMWLDELIFLVPYSLLMQLFATGYRTVGIDQLAFMPRLAFDLLGFIISFAGLVMYSDCAWCFHPHDILSTCLKTKWNPKFMKLFNLIIPLLIIFALFFKNHTIYALHVGTIIGLLFQNRISEFFEIEYSRLLRI
ncbi:MULTISPECIES: hypothetical protein [Lactobacillus]|uniref:Sugar specific permease (Putative) n=1 Tax=Lactobacillus xujianguonis TaxID=2495899 RepID=A0A437SVC6_9LACO|nr:MULTISPECIES: hypothetical protein [Lactobacillus]RVU70800.1 hypothetical protein EJK17_05225 [Lactobacillus xujianguonis]RVU77008.1 hypothetical protein EJK20_02545 [Lactobacillus xujianguonis]